MFKWYLIFQQVVDKETGSTVCQIKVPSSSIHDGGSRPALPMEGRGEDLLYGNQ